jgi:hypothetical protein
LDVLRVFFTFYSYLSTRFGRHVSEAVRDWKFVPSTCGGEPTASELRLRFPVKIR